MLCRNSGDCHRNELVGSNANSVFSQAAKFDPVVESLRRTLSQPMPSLCNRAAKTVPALADNRAQQCEERRRSLAFLKTSIGEVKLTARRGTVTRKHDHSHTWLQNPQSRYEP